MTNPDWFAESIVLQTMGDGETHVLTAPEYAAIDQNFVDEMKPSITYKIGTRTFFLLPDDVIYEEHGIGDFGRFYFVKRVTHFYYPAE